MWFLSDSVSIASLIILVVVVVFHSFYWLHRHNYLNLKYYLQFLYGKIYTDSEFFVFVSQITYVLDFFSKKHIGALIVFENKNNLKAYTDTGCQLTANFTPDLLKNIFVNKESAFHDGGVIMKGMKVIAVSAYFPITKKKINSSYGARHRSAMGVTEITDAISFVVSESSGNISFVKGGKIEKLDNPNLGKLTDKINSLLDSYLK